jgi:hypothetical protein
MNLQTEDGASRTFHTDEIFRDTGVLRQWMNILSGSLWEFLLLVRALVAANLVGPPFLVTDFKDLQFRW